MAFPRPRVQAFKRITADVVSISILKAHGCDGNTSPKLARLSRVTVDKLQNRFAVTILVRISNSIKDAETELVAIIGNDLLNNRGQLLAFNAVFIPVHLRTFENKNVGGLLGTVADQQNPTRRLFCYPHSAYQGNE